MADGHAENDREINKSKPAARVSVWRRRRRGKRQRAERDAENRPTAYITRTMATNNKFDENRSSVYITRSWNATKQYDNGKIVRTPASDDNISTFARVSEWVARTVSLRINRPIASRRARRRLSSIISIAYQWRSQDFEIKGEGRAKPKIF